MYCSTLYFGLSSTQLDKFEKVNERPIQIINTGNPPTIERVKMTLQRNAAIDVFKCVHKLNPINLRHFNNHFIKMIHTHNTRGNDSTLHLPRIKNEARKRSLLTIVLLYCSIYIYICIEL